MSRDTKVPAIPDVRENNVLEVLRALKMTADLREGRVGDGLDAFATMRDLTDLGVATEGESDGSGGGTLPITPIGGVGPGGDGYDPTTDTSVPPAPTGLVAEGVTFAVYLSWIPGRYRNHAHTEIWRAGEDDLSKAVLVGNAFGQLYSDPAETNTTYWYWIRFVSKASIVGPYNSTSGTSVTTSFLVGPLLEALSEEISNTDLFKYLRERVQQIDVDNIIANRALVSELELLEVRVNNNVSRILELHSITETQATKLEQIITTGSTGGNRIFFTSERPDGGSLGFVDGKPLNAGDLWYDIDNNNKSSRWDSVGGVMDWVDFPTTVWVYWQDDDPAFPDGAGVWIDDNGRPLREGDMWYEKDQNNKPHRWRAGGGWDDVSDQTAIASITNLEQTKVGYATLNVISKYGPAGAVFDGDGVVWNNAPLPVLSPAEDPKGHDDYLHSVQKWNTLHNNTPALLTPPEPTSDSELTWHIGLPFAHATKQVSISSDGGATWVTVQQQFVAFKKTDGDLLAQYTIKIDSRGYVSGFGLANTTPVSGPTTSIFMVNADRFAIAPAMARDAYNPTVNYGEFATVYYASLTTPPVIHVFQSVKAGNVGHTPIHGVTKPEDMPNLVPPQPEANFWWRDLDARFPFIATTTATQIDGKTYPPGVWMNTANIAKATIEDAQITTLRADKITTGTLKATINITTGLIYYGVLIEGDPTPPVVGSPEFGEGYFLGVDRGTIKFLVGSYASRVFWNGTRLEVKGHIEATSGKIGGISMAYVNMGTAETPRYEGRLYAPSTVTGLTTGSAGFYLDETGQFRVGHPTGRRIMWDNDTLRIKADVEAIGGTFHTLTFAPETGEYIFPRLYFGITDWYHEGSGPDPGDAVYGNGFMLGKSTDDAGAGGTGKANFFVGKSIEGDDANARYIWYDGNTFTVAGDLIATGNIRSENVSITRSNFYDPSATIGSLPGTGITIFTTICNLAFNLPYAADVTLHFTARHSYTGSGDQRHHLRFKRDGVAFLDDVALQGESDYAAVGFAWDGTLGTKLPKGPHTITVEWAGGSNNVRLKRALAVATILYR